MPTFVQNYRPFGEDAVKAHKGYDAFLLALTEQEVAQREANRQRLCIKAARFPLLKELSDFDFSCVPALNKQQVLDLARGSYIPKAEPITGPTFWNLRASRSAFVSACCGKRRRRRSDRLRAVTKCGKLGQPTYQKGTLSSGRMRFATIPIAKGRMTMADQSQTLVSPRESLRQSIDAYQLSQCLYVAAKLGIADLLKDGPKPYEELAKASGAQPTALFRVLRALVSAGIFNRLQNGRFALNEVSEYLCSEVTGSLRAWAILAGEQPYPAWSQLLYTVQTGEPGFDHLFGMSNWQYRVQNPAAAQVFNAAMSEGVRASTAAITQAYDFARFERIVDVGGGQGGLLAGILKVNSSVHGVLFDLEHVVASAKEPLGEAGISERCEVVAGSFLEGVPAGGDAYILKDIILNWTDQESVGILTNCRQAMKEKGVLLIIERVIASDQPTLEATMVDLRMMVMLGGQARTREEFQALLRGAGFELTKFIPTRTPYQILEGKSV